MRRCERSAVVRGGRAGTALSLTLFLAALAGCDPTAPLEHSVGTVMAVRGTTTVADAPGGPIARVPVGGTVSVSSPGLADCTLDLGARLLLDAGSRAALDSEDSVRIESGRVYLEVMSGDTLSIETVAGFLTLADAAVSLTHEGTITHVYVVRGEVSYRSGDARGLARAGEELTLTQGAAATVEPRTLWDDWTGGLVRPGPEMGHVSPGMGVLEARVPDEIGMARWPLVIRRLDVSVRIEGSLAITEVTEEFFNPASETVEGLYRVSVPEGAVLQRFAVDRNGRMVDGYVREQATARREYEARVYAGSTEDPALLEWDAPGHYRARIYPIAAGEVRRIAIRYAEWLAPGRDGGPLLYRYPMAGGERAPHVGELSFVADVSSDVTNIRAGLDASVDGSRVELRRSDFRPRSDLYLELTRSAPVAARAFRASHTPPTRAPGAAAPANEADERDYWYLPLELPAEVFGDAEAGTLDLVVVADVSAATDRNRLELGRTMVEAITSHLGEGDRISIVGADLRLRGLGDGGDMALGPADSGRVEPLLDALARTPAGGATDLGASLAEAAALLDPARGGAVIYVGDGAPTVGEIEAEELRAHLAELPHPVRLYAVAVGADANLDLLSEVVRGAGLAMRVEEREGAAEAALRILGHAGRPIVEGVSVDLGAGIENAFPRVPLSVARGEIFEVVGRVSEAPPTSVVVTGTFHGEAFTREITVSTESSEEGTDLRLRWASERLRQHLRENASREEIAELGTRYGLITPYTSYYVPSWTEMMGSGYSHLLHTPLLGPPAPSDGEAALATAFAVVVLPLTLTGCAESAAPAGSTSSSWEPEAEEVDFERSNGSPVAAVPPVTTPTTGLAPGLAGEPMPTVPMAPPSVAPSPPPPPEAAARAAPAADPATTDALRALGYADDFGGEDLDRSGGSYGSGEGSIGLGSTGTIGHGTGTGSGYGLGGLAGTGAGGGGTARPSSGPMRPDSANREGEEVTESRRRGRVHATAEPNDDDTRGGRYREGDAAEIVDAPTEIGGGRLEDSLRGAATGADAGIDGWADHRERSTTVITTVITTTSGESHTRSHCSDASRSSLDDRRALWTERLAQTDSISSWIDIYRTAIRDCEARTSRERRALLDELIDRSGSLPRMLDVYGYLYEGSARSYLRRVILRRVRTADDLRLVRSRLGTTAYTDLALIEQVLARATTPAARLRALRDLIEENPGNFDLRLRLLEELEVQHRTAEATRLADDLRTDPMADAGVRTAIGELYLRLDREDEARRAFSEIVEFAPFDELARRRLGDLYRAHGWFEEAYRQYATLATIRPDDSTVLLLQAQAAAGAGRTDEALRLEQRLMEMGDPRGYSGLARVAQLWSSVRFASLRSAAREGGDTEALTALRSRMSRSGVLHGARPFRATLTWSHPDARLSLWAAHPSMPLSRPDDLAPEFGIEAFDVAEIAPGTYRIEVRRLGTDRLGTIEAQLVLVWNEGREDEEIRVVPLTFDPAHATYGWTIVDHVVTAAPTTTPTGGAR